MERSNRETIERLGDVRGGGLPPTTPRPARRGRRLTAARATGSKLGRWPRRTGPTRRPDDRPELLIKLQERKERHKQRNILHRAAVVVFGVLIVCAGIVMSGPGVPGPGIVTIIIGLGFLALEFDRAERLLERVIIWGDRAAERAEQHDDQTARGGGHRAGSWPRAAFAVAAFISDIPLMPLL